MKLYTFQYFLDEKCEDSVDTRFLILVIVKSQTLYQPIYIYIYRN